MGEFLTLVVIVAGIVWLFRFLRRREQERFRETDTRLLRELAGDALPEPPAPEPAPAGRQSAPDLAVVDGIKAAAPVQAAPIGASLRPAALDDIHANLLVILEEVLGDRYRVFVNKPLADFVRTERAGELVGRTIAFLACEPKDYRVVFGLALRGAGQAEVARFQYLERLFGELGVPLASLPMVQSLSRAEVEAALGGLTPSPLRQRDRG